MAWDTIWEEVFIHNEWGKYPGESLIRFIAKNFYQSKREDIKILEIGCGTGANIWYLARERFQTFGIDGSVTGIEIIKKRLEKENLTADLKVGDILNLPYNNSCFDAVIDIECLCTNSFESSVLTLKEVFRVLKKNGLFFSRSFTNKMYIGNTPPPSSSNKYEFEKITEGPLSGKGFVRLLPKQKIKELYGKIFEVLSIDKEEYTRDNGNMVISEWIIVSRKSL